MSNTAAVDMDVFAAARWMSDLWNSRARAICPHLIEWECQTSGSAMGRGTWEETAMFYLAAEWLELEMRRNCAKRDELVVMVPVTVFPDLFDLIELVGESPYDWPWLCLEVDDEEMDEDEYRAAQIDCAAEYLYVCTAELTADRDLLQMVGLA